MKSIRLYLIAALFSSIAIVIFIAMLVGYQRSLKQANSLFEHDLEDKYQLISHLLLHFQDEKNTVHNIDNDLDHLKKFSALYQVIDKNGQVVLQSGDLGELPLTQLTNGTTDFNFNGRRWHALVKQPEYLPYRIMVAEQDDLRYWLADSIIVDILRPIIIGLFFIVLLVWFIIHAGFKPIEQLTKSIREKSASDLSTIPSKNIPAELHAISKSVNELFVRLTSSFDREKRFTSDAAHEMRNPITALKIHIDNLLEEMPEKSEPLLKIKQAIDRLSSLVEQMLVLHRMSPDQYIANFSCINLRTVTQEVIAEIYPDIEKKSQSIEFEGKDCSINADLFGIEVLIKNLIGNASKYTPKQGRIRVSLSADEASHEGVILSIEDSGCGIPDTEKQRVFDRFYRVGGDRHHSKTIGSGLGLSIVKHIADLHQATLDLATSEWGGLCVTVHFPRQRSCTSTMDSSNEL